MNECERDIVLKAIEIIDQVLSGKRKVNPDISDMDDIEDEEIKNLVTKVVTLGRQYRDAYEFIIDLSCGKLFTESPRMNVFANPFKQLQSELRHLTWQIQEIANGDYDQRVSFSGDFSEAINKTIKELRERQTLADINRENEYLFRSIFSTSPDGIVICDFNKYIINASNATKEMLQLADSDIARGIYFMDLIAEADREKGKSFLNELKENSSTAFAELRMATSKGKSFWSEQNASVLFDSNGEPKGTIIIIRDITERKANEEQLIKIAGDLNESNKTKDRLFSIIAHDLKNPFNALLGFSKLLMDEADKGNMDKVKKYAKIVHSSSKNTFNLLVNLLEWSRLQTKRITITPELSDLDDLITHNIEIGNTTALAKSIKLEFITPGHYPLITDRAIVNTVLRNLIGNAIKYTPANGTVTVSVKQENDWYLVSVQDVGVGIRKEDIDKLFRLDVLHTTPGTGNEKGSGLGLILCKDFINKIGGNISVQSVYGKGATFTFSIPCAILM